VQAIIELPLEGPFELRMIQVTRMELEVVGMHGDTRILELNDDFHSLAFSLSGKIEQRVLIQPELGKNAIQSGIAYGRHASILTERKTKPQRTQRTRRKTEKLFVP